eukprot:COSAG04_NODE_89_length_27118_cov_11.171176_12_plen_184_part_00
MVLGVLLRGARRQRPLLRFWRGRTICWRGARARRTAGPAHARTSLDAVALDGVEAVRSVAVRLPRVCAVAPCYGWLGKGRRAAIGLTSVARVGAQGGGVVRVDADCLVQEAVALHPAAQRHVLRLRAEDAVVGLRAEGISRLPWQGGGGGGEGAHVRPAQQLLHDGAGRCRAAQRAADIHHVL